MIPISILFQLILFFRLFSILCYSGFPIWAFVTVGCFELFLNLQVKEIIPDNLGLLYPRLIYLLKPGLIPNNNILWWVLYISRVFIAIEHKIAASKKFLVPIGRRNHLYTSCL